MEFYERVDQVAELVRHRRRVTYRSLREQFDLDNAALEAITEELFFAHPEIRDEDSRGLIWRNEAGPSTSTPSGPMSPSHAATDPEREPLSYD